MFLMEAFKEGGWGMYPILTVFIITAYLVIERTAFLGRAKINIEQLMGVIKSQIVAGNLRGAISTCDATPAGATKIIAAGLRKAEQGGAEHEIQQAMDEEALRELPRIEKRTGYLAMLGNLATLCGLLGTITGLIKSFASVAGVESFHESYHALQGYLGGHELHRVRARHRHLGPCCLRRAQRQDPAHSRRRQPVCG